MIYLYFGSKLTRNAVKDVNNFAINWEISIDTARIVYLAKLVEMLSERNGGSCYWDGLFGHLSEKYVYAPNLKVEVIEEGSSRLPVITLDSIFMREEKTRLMIPIDDATLDYVGREIEEQFGVEYLECSRDKLGNIKTSTHQNSHNAQH